MLSIRRPKGTFDILPEQMRGYCTLEQTARDVAARYGFSEVRTPTFEETALFARGVGDTTDVVQKEMYTFPDREGRSLSLRPEGTAPLARAIIEGGRCGGAMPLKLFYILNCFRYERPQAGRSREFWQFGAELYGAPTPEADTEVLDLASSYLREIGLGDAALHINSLGCKSCRPRYKDALQDYFRARENDLCPTCRARLEVNPLRILDCKDPSCRAIAAGAPKTVDYLCEDCRAHLARLESLLHDLSVPYTLDPSIVRGLDYYTRTVFEFITDAPGAQGTLCGGGRYDGLVEQLGGPPLSAIGFAMGLSRLLLARAAKGIEEEPLPSPALFIAPMGQACAARAMALVKDLRGAGVFAESDLIPRSLKAMMKYADKRGARYTLLLGEQELASGTAQLKNMATSAQTQVRIDSVNDLLTILRGE